MREDKHIPVLQFEDESGPAALIRAVFDEKNLQHPLRFIGDNKEDLVTFASKLQEFHNRVLIIVDNSMPTISGLEVVETAIKNGVTPDNIIIFSSSIHEKEAAHIKARYQQLGITEIRDKTLEDAEAIAEWVHQRTTKLTKEIA